MIGLFIAMVLAIVALLHFAWGLGSVWPAKSKPELVAMAIGTKGETRMPPAWLTLIVALGIGAAALIALWGAGWVDLPFPQWMRAAGLGVLCVIFLIRGAATYLHFRALNDTVEPFRRLNRMAYSPLILVIGFGYLYLLIAG